MPRLPWGKTPHAGKVESRWTAHGLGRSPGRGEAEHQKHSQMFRDALSLPLAGDGRSDRWMSIAAAPTPGCSTQTCGRSPDKALVSVITLHQLPKATQEMFCFTFGKSPE